MPDDRFPDFVYKILACDAWATAVVNGVVAYSEHDRRDGFMHLSKRAQTLETAKRHYAGQINLLALEIPFSKIADAVKFEPALGRDGEEFPHLFSELSSTHVRQVIMLIENDDGSFSFGENLV